MQIPEEIYVIFDLIDGPHFYKSETQALRDLKKWQEESNSDPFDSVWDMKGPFKYKLDNSE